MLLKQYFTVLCRLLKYDPVRNTTEVLLRNLYFANGVQLSPNEDFILICETAKMRVTKYAIFIYELFNWVLSYLLHDRHKYAKIKYRRHVFSQVQSKRRRRWEVKYIYRQFAVSTRQHSDQFNWWLLDRLCRNALRIETQHSWFSGQMAVDPMDSYESLLTPYSIYW